MPSRSKPVPLPLVEYRGGWPRPRTEMLAAADSYIRRGWPILICSTDKVPFFKGGWASGSSDPVVVKHWLQSHPAAMLALAPKTASLVIVDYDRYKDDAPRAWRKLMREIDGLPATLSAQTPSALVIAGQRESALPQSRRTRQAQSVDAHPAGWLRPSEMFWRRAVYPAGYSARNRPTQGRT